MIPYSSPVAAKNIPVIDVSGLSAGDMADRKHVAHKIHRACRQTGFFYASHHGIPSALMQAQLEWTARLFAQSPEQKNSINFANSPRRLGYEPMLQQVLDAGSAPDLKESYMYAAPFRASGEAPNLWPSELDGFRDQMLAYHEAVGELGSRLMGGLALSLDLDEAFFETAFDGAQFAVRLLRYPPQQDDPSGNQLGAGAHTDWGGITLLLQDERGGLEVQTNDGTWIRAEPIDGTFVVNLGDLLRRWTNDIYKSTLHRVLNNRSGRDRHSVATFFSPRPDVQVACIPSCAEDRPTLYPPITAGEHTAEMVRRTYGH